MRRVAIVTALLLTTTVHAQKPWPAGFDFATITRNTTDLEAVPFFPGFPTTAAGVGSIWNATTEQLIGLAYRLETFATPLVRPDGLRFDWDARFDIVARPPDGSSAAQQYTMLRTLLAVQPPMPGLCSSTSRSGNSSA